MRVLALALVSTVVLCPRAPTWITLKSKRPVHPAPRRRASCSPWHCDEDQLRLRAPVLSIEPASRRRPAEGKPELRAPHSHPAGLSRGLSGLLHSESALARGPRG